MIDYELERKKRGERATKQQRKSADPKHSVWVEASAGTGKTKVLSDRVLRLLLLGVSPSKILCLTYTKAAAVEMSNRVSGRLARFSVIKDEDLKKELESLLGEIPQNEEDLVRTARRLFAVLLDTPGGIKFQTIHSFCQEILKRFPLEAKVSPYFEVMDERASKEALEKAKKRVLRQIDDNPEDAESKEMGHLIFETGEFSFAKVMSEIISNRGRIAEFFEKNGGMANILQKLAERLDVVGIESKEDVLAKFCQDTDKESIKEVMNALLKGSDSDKKKASSIASFLENKAAFYEEYKKAFLNKDGSIQAKMTSKKAVDFKADLVEKMIAEAERLKRAEKTIASLGLFASTKAVLVLSGRILKEYCLIKKQYSQMDYEDLIVFTRNLLERKGVADWVLFKLDGGIDHLLIDEAQDTSPDQWAIIKLLTEEFFAQKNNRTIFVVGDKKQSIYSFQGADVSEFERSKKHFASKISNFEEVHLDVSFRSTSAIMDVVNQSFLNSKLKGVSLDEPHQPYRVGDAGKVEFWEALKPLAGENREEWRKPVERETSVSTSARLAKEIAFRIKKMVEEKELLPSKDRAVRFGDFLVLVQRRDSFVEELIREFKNIGVNVGGIDKIKLLEQIAVQDLIALGKFLLLPTDDLMLATILKSPLFGLDDDDLFELCHNRGKTPLWTVLGRREKYAVAYKMLQSLLNMADFVRPYELYANVLNKLGGRKKFVERIGLEAEDGIDEFMNLTFSFEKDHIPSLQLFIDWISRDEVEIKREQEQRGADVVRIMTVHGSKGLQAPIVVLPDSVRVPPAKREMKMLWDDVVYCPLGSSSYDENCEKIFLQEKENMIAEYRRLLYVALTRAEDRLYVCGYQRKRAPEEKSWYEEFKKSIREIGEEENGNIKYEVSQTIAPKKEKELLNKEKIRPNFAWLYKEAPVEGALSKPFTPSKSEEEEEVFSPISTDDKNKYFRGSLMHKILQVAPDIAEERREFAVRQFIKQNAHQMPDVEKDKIAIEILGLFQDERFKSVFEGASMAEVPIIGEVDGRIVSAQIDRLVVKEKEVLIFDYKTNRVAAEKLEDVPAIYLKQMNEYKKLVEKIYSDKKVSAYIIWTNAANIMHIC